MLQPDSTQRTNQLLSDISSELRGTNVARPTSLDAVPFTPSTTARWINTLFFLSLVFSLTAALFGILVKQWLREYMRWNSSLGSPRENVLIRQVRFEAWEAWNVAATISSIPTLLELAMILFLLGLNILLWTLDSVVAVVITVASAVFIGALSAFTVSPVFFERCPYKSPTAWACTVLSETICDFLQSFLHLCTRLGCNIPVHKGQKGPQRGRNWREGGEAAYTFRGGAAQEQLYRAVEGAIHAERAGLSDDGVILAEPRRDFSRVFTSRAALQDIHEVAILFRALSWVYKASDDAQIRAHIVECMDTIHSVHPRNTLEACAITNVSDWCLLWALQTGNLLHPENAFLPTNAGLAGVTVVQRMVREMWTLQRVKVPGGFQIVSRIKQRVQFGGINVPEMHDAGYAPLVAHLIDSDLQSWLRSLQHLVMPYHFTVAPAAIGRFSLEMLSFLGFLYSTGLVAISDLHLRGIHDMLSDKELKRTLDTCFPGLRSSALLVAARASRVEPKDGAFHGSSYRLLSKNCG